jgi:hypothetical protein
MLTGLSDVKTELSVGFLCVMLLKWYATRAFIFQARKPRTCCTGSLEYIHLTK